MHLNEELDDCYKGVEHDLTEIADNMLDWEKNLATYLGLTPTDIDDIKHTQDPELQRYCWAHFINPNNL